MSSRALKYICGYTTLAVFNHFFATQCIYIIAQKFCWGKHRIYVHRKNYNIMMLFQLSQWKKQEAILFFFSFYTFSLILFLFVYFRLRHFEWYSLFPCLFPCCLISITISTWNLSCDTQKKCQLKHFSFIFWVPHSATFFFFVLFNQNDWQGNSLRIRGN